MSSNNWNIQTYGISATNFPLKMIQVAEILIINTNHKVSANKDETNSQVWEQLEEK
jgi:hypothetical protein